MDTAHFQIAASPVGGRIRVNGDDLTSKVARVHVDLGQAEPTVLTLQLLAGVDPSSIEGRGIVHVATDVDRAQAIVEFLSQVDPGQLEQAALFLEGAGTLTQKMLAVLIDQAEAAG